MTEPEVTITELKDVTLVTKSGEPFRAGLAEPITLPADAVIDEATFKDGFVRLRWHRRGEGDR